MNISRIASDIRRAAPVKPVTKTETGNEYQDYLKNKKPEARKSPDKKPEHNFYDMVQKEINKKS